MFRQNSLVIFLRLGHWDGPSLEKNESLQRLPMEMLVTLNFYACCEHFWIVLLATRTGKVTQAAYYFYTRPDNS